jgi:hypothetical protein
LSRSKSLRTSLPVRARRWRSVKSGRHVTIRRDAAGTPRDAAVARACNSVRRAHPR